MSLEHSRVKSTYGASSGNKLATPKLLPGYTASICADFIFGLVVSITYIWYTTTLKYQFILQAKLESLEVVTGDQGTSKTIGLDHQRIRH